MAKIRLNQIMEAIRGRIGRIVFRVRPDGTIIISGAPRYRKGKGSPAQKAHRQRVRRVAPYAKVLAKTHPIYAELAAGEVARGKWMSAYNFAFADCMKPPVIHRIERSEDLVRVEATDNIMVNSVQVFVQDEAGMTLETGFATRAEGDWWEFACHAKGKTIVAEARDLTWNVTRHEA